MRSDMYNFAWASKRFWDGFEKPAIFGEAGADLTYYKPGSKEYHVSYHNQIWASLANGLAGTPVWWDFSILNEDDWKQLSHLSKFVSDIDFANLPYKPAVVNSDVADIFIMDSGDKGFGWLRSISNHDVVKILFSLAKQGSSNYTVTWFDTWTGNIVKMETIKSLNGKLDMAVPEMTNQNRDIAFKISKN
jgi:hypothetical protein